MPDSIIKTNNITTLAGDTAPRIPDGSSTKPSLAFANDPNTGLYRISEDKIGIAVGGQKAGEVGIGYGGFTGNVIQIAYAELTTSGVTATASIPVDNTIPQQTEGAEILTCGITPKYSNSILYIESNSFLGENTNTADSIVAALFKDTQLDAICTGFNNAGPSGSSPFGGAISFNPIYMQCRLISGSISPITFKLRAGGGGPGAAAVRWNGGNGSQYFNGTLITYIKITEIQT